MAIGALCNRIREMPPVLPQRDRACILDSGAQDLCLKLLDLGNR
jgi:hypothetical protein